MLAPKQDYNYSYFGKNRPQLCEMFGHKFEFVKYHEAFLRLRMSFEHLYYNYKAATESDSNSNQIL